LEKPKNTPHIAKTMRYDAQTVAITVICENDKLPKIKHILLELCKNTCALDICQQWFLEGCL